MELKILYEDKELLVAVKPEGVDSESSNGLAPDMVNMIRNHLAKKGEGSYVGVIHRLDRPVSGIMVFAKTKEAAAFLSKELQNGKIGKKYRAVVCGQPKEKSGIFTDFMIKEAKGNISRVADPKEKGAKEAKLKYSVIRKKFTEGEQLAEVGIELLTGRHHQIRVQFSSRDLPLLGDRKYNKAYSETPLRPFFEKEKNGPLCLASVYLSFKHPKTKKQMEFSMEASFSL